MITNATIARLRALRRAVLEDGKVDWDETGRLLDFVRPLAKGNDYLFQDFERFLKRCRADGRITREESQLLAVHLDALTSYLTSQRLKFWLIVSVVILLVLATFLVGQRVCETTENVGAMAAPQKP